MRFLISIFSLLYALTANTQGVITENFFLTISPIVNKEEAVNKKIISALTDFLTTKNNSPSKNKNWLSSDFQKYIYPYLDIYNIEDSRYGKGFYKPTLLEIIQPSDKNKRIAKIAYLGYNKITGEHQLKLIINLVVNIQEENIFFSNYLKLATTDWQQKKIRNLHYFITPNKIINKKEIKLQLKDINKIEKFFNSQQLPITYYSCKNPKEIFSIKGFDYHPMMYVDSTGGLAEFGNIIFSGNNSERYSHEIVHIYSNTLFPKINKFIDEGIATLLFGSGKQDYEWHRNNLKNYLTKNPDLDFLTYLSPYERNFIDDNTSLPYITAALICERTVRIYGKQTLFNILNADKDLLEILLAIGLHPQNINEELRKELLL